MRKVKLLNIVKTLESGSRPKGGSQESGAVSIGGGQLSPNGRFNFSKKVFVPRAFYDKLKKGKIEKDDILIVKDGATTGKTSYVSDDFPYKEAAINEHVFRVVIDKEVASSRYVFYYLFSPYGQLEIQKDFRGAAVGGITRKFINRVEVPLPNIKTQSKIVAVLDKASRLIQKREESIELLDELLRAQFLKMFEDPILNSKGWELVSLSEIGKFKSGGTPSKKNEEYWMGNFPWVSPKDMKTDFIIDSIDHISERVFEETSLKKIEKENILIVVRGMILAHSFPVAINTVPVAINQDMKAIELSEGFLPSFVLNCLKNMKELLLNNVSTAGHGTKKFPSEAISKVKIPKPDIGLQIQFDSIQHNLLIAKNKIKRNQDYVQNLFDSILQKAFKGELEFNADAESDIELDALIDVINILEKENDLTNISNDEVYLQRLVDRVNSEQFKTGIQYQKIKHAIFQLLKEGKINQDYDSDNENVKLKLT